MLGMLVSLTLGGCAAAHQIKASPGQEFTLAAGQSAAITGENMTIQFVSVTSDSRCPQGVTCIWAGEVSCTVKITFSGKAPFNVELTQSGGSNTAAQEFDGHTINFQVSPYPTAGKKIATEDYRLTMTVNKTPPISTVIDLAPINDVQITTTLSQPPQVLVDIQVGLRDTCTTFYSLNTTRSGNVITMNVYVQHLTGQACGQVYTFFNKNVNLGSDFAAGKTYSFNVNGKVKSFTMP